MTVFRCAAAWLPDGVSGPVDIRSDEAGLIAAIEPAGAGPVDQVLPGLVFPGFADAHSHVFHRALRGRTHAGTDPATPGSFWTWRDTMYALAGRLTPETFGALARATYAELVCAGFTAVGEFHYLHHQRDGRPYDEPNLLGLAAVAAGADAGLNVTLLDTAYLAGGFDQPVAGAQVRYSDGDVQRWAERVAALPADIRHGVAIHSVRAVPPPALPVVAQVAATTPTGVLHVHLSEQPAENAACLAATGRTPTALLSDAGAIGPRTAAVHATHLTPADIALLGAHAVTAVICPATEADLADGLPAAGALAAAGTPLALGGDQHVLTDPLAAARGLEWGERLATGRRGTFAPAQLVRAATVAGHRAIGSPAGVLEVGAPADLVAVRTDTVRTAGAEPAQLIMAATAADVAVVVVGGRVQAIDGVHVRLGDPGPLLADAVAKAWQT
jgi:formiminoglutamate deiminase